MFFMSKKTKIQRQFATSTQVQTQTTTSVQVQTNVSSVASLNEEQLIDRNKFIALLKKRLGDNFSTNDEQLWDKLLGNYRYDHYGLVQDSKIIFRKSNEDNPNVHYLTMASFEKILSHRLQFRNGIDFQHLPEGFLLSKNPRGGGVCDVLHYDEGIILLQPKDALDSLKITLMSQDELQAASPLTSLPFNPFKGLQAEWYDFLQKKRVSDDGVIFCTQEQLLAAFSSFSNTISKMGLNYYKPEFSHELKSSQVNPIVLLGRWETIMSNRHLKDLDIKDQWQEIPKLPLVKGHEAIRAITDYENDENPCSYVGADMLLDEEHFVFIYPNSDIEYCGFRMEYIKRFGWPVNAHMFLRYVSYTSKRQSMNFYREAFNTLLTQNKVTEVTKEIVFELRNLLYRTTNDNYTACDSSGENREFNGWKTYLSGKNFEIDGDLSLFIHSNSHSFMSSFIEYFEKNKSLDFYNDPIRIKLRKISKLRPKMSRHMYSIDGGSLYQGAKFYFNNNEWQGMAIGEYIDLLIHGYEKAYEDSNKKFYFSCVANLLSTFKIKDIKDYDKVLDKFNKNLSYEELITYSTILNYLFSVENNDNLTPQKFIELLDWCENNKKGCSDEKIYEFLEQNFGKNFPARYFEFRRAELRQGGGSIGAIINLSFNRHAVTYIINILRAIESSSSNVSFDLNEYVDDISNLLLSLQGILLSEDFILFVQKLDDIKEIVAQDSNSLLKLVASIREKRTLEGFGQIFARYEFLRNSDDNYDPNLLKKFLMFIDYIKPLTNGIADLNLDILMLQETLATVVLNSSPEDIVDNKKYNDTIETLVDTLQKAATEHPHIKDYLLNSLNNMPDVKTKYYMQNIITFSKNLKDILAILSSGNDPDAKERMSIIYSLLANYHSNPADLNKLITSVMKLENKEKILFALKFISRLRDNHQSVDGVDELVDNLKSSESITKNFIKLCKTPPYPDVTTLLDWLKSNNFTEKHKAFMLRPYGARKLEYAFNRKTYDKQKKNFSGLDKVFTDDVGNAIFTHLQENLNKPIDDLIAEFKDVGGGVSKISSEKNNDKVYDNSLLNSQKLKLLCLAVELLARTASQKSHDNPEKIISQELNATQIMALYAQMTNPNDKLISQIDTGEGKSRIMMILVACLAAQGKTVDFLTSDMQLSERDYLSYKQFFTALNIPTSLISLNTPKQLYNKGGVNFTDNSQLILLRNKSDIDNTPNDYLDEREELRCLVLDEADTFIHDKSKDSFNYASDSPLLAKFVWIYPQLIMYLQSLGLAPDSEFEPKDHVNGFVDFIDSRSNESLENKAKLYDLLDSNPMQITTWLTSAHVAVNSHVGIDYVLTIDKKDKMYLMRDNDGNMRYSRKIFVLDNGRPVVDSTFSDGVHQCVCAKENLLYQEKNPGKRIQESFVIEPEKNILRASFTDNFMEQYNLMYGVTGTARAAAALSGEKTNYQGYDYITVPREKELKRADKDVWLAKDDAQQIKFIKHEIIEKLKNNSPILIICKDDSQSELLHQVLTDEKFINEIKQHNLKFDLQHVHALTSSKNEKQAIAKAGNPSQITISTAGMFGRGVDIHADNLVVLATYVPTTEDEIQIKGRTGRMGKSGEYRMIINMLKESLVGKTHNAQYQVQSQQKMMQSESDLEKDTNYLFSFFHEYVTKLFVREFHNCKNEDKVKKLEEWRMFFNNMENDFDNNIRSKLLSPSQNNNKQSDILSNDFLRFVDRWIDEANNLAKIKNTPEDVSKFKQQQKDKVDKVSDAIADKRDYFTPYRKKLKTTHGGYHPSHDGQAVVYTKWFEKSRATLRGQRAWFADFYAWKEGRGHVFPNVTAIMHGERGLFTALRAIIDSLIVQFKGWAVSTQSGYKTSIPSAGELEHYLKDNLKLTPIERIP